MPAPAPSGTETAADVAKGVGKGLLNRAIAVPEAAADAFTSGTNLLARGVNKVTGSHFATENPLPSEALDEVLGKSKTKAGKAAEIVSSLGPTTKTITEAERALFGAEEYARMKISGGKVPESERIRQEGNSVGFKYSPSEVPDAKVSRQLTSVTGKARQEEEVSAHNLDKTQDLVAAEFHLPQGTEFTDQTFDRLEKPAFDAYERVANLGEVNTSPAYRAAVEKAGTWGGQAETDFPKDTPTTVLQLRGAYNVAKFTGRGALEKIKQLRVESRLDVQSRDPERMAVGKAKKDIAAALEAELDLKAQSVGQAQLLTQFRNARRYLAKINAVRDAMLGGKVSARALANQLSEGSPLDGNLKIIAESALQNPKSFQDVQRKGLMGAYTVHDLWAMAAGTMGWLTGSGEGKAVAGLAAASVARPAVRAAIRSPIVQRSITRPSGTSKATKFLATHPGVGASAAVQSEDLGDSGP